jgi:hypothetical protein
VPCGWVGVVVVVGGGGSAGILPTFVGDPIFRPVTNC